MADPRTPAEWQTAVDLAEAVVALDACKQYGLVEGGPGLNVERAVAILAAGKARGVVLALAAEVRGLRDRVRELEAVIERMANESGEVSKELAHISDQHGRLLATCDATENRLRELEALARIEPTGKPSECEHDCGCTKFNLLLQPLDGHYKQTWVCEDCHGIQSWTLAPAPTPKQLPVRKDGA